MSLQKSQHLKIVILPALLIAAATLYLGFTRSATGTRLPFRSFDVVQVNGTKNAEMVAISSDARRLAYVMEESGRQSLWVRTLEDGAQPIRLLAAANVQFRALTFSPDNSFVYYSHTDPAKGPEADYYILYRVPVNGGEPQRLINDIDTNVTFSQDGTRILFLRANDPEPGTSNVIEASVDGGNEKIIQSAPNRESIKELAWSPDGRSIAEVPFFQTGWLGMLSVRDVSSGKTQTVFKTEDHMLNELAWLPSGEALALIYRSKENGLTLGQIGLVTYPDGKFSALPRT
jgi:Tol biopolymer transport system component